MDGGVDGFGGEALFDHAVNDDLNFVNLGVDAGFDFEGDVGLVVYMVVFGPVDIDFFFGKRGGGGSGCGGGGEGWGRRWRVADFLEAASGRVVDDVGKTGDLACGGGGLGLLSLGNCWWWGL